MKKQTIVTKITSTGRTVKTTKTDVETDRRGWGGYRIVDQTDDRGRTRTNVNGRFEIFSVRRVRGAEREGVLGRHKER